MAAREAPPTHQRSPFPRTARRPGAVRRASTAIATLATLLPLAAPAAAQDANPRFGQWKLRSDAPPPALNIMTYEPYGDGGMRITVESTNGQGETTKWGYVTLFDGAFRPVTGRENTETAVDVVDERTNKITTRRNGRLAQTIVNVLSEDGNRIDNEYRSVTEDGSERVSHAVYERIR